jgi:hypothetical protein
MADITAADLTPSTHPAAALLALIEPKLASRVAVDENARINRKLHWLSERDYTTFLD